MVLLKEGLEMSTELIALLRRMPRACEDIVDDIEQIRSIIEDETRRLQKAVADESAQVANWMIMKGYATGHGDTISSLLDGLDRQARADERAKIAKESGKTEMDVF